jgi:hypothetical protein
MKEIGEAIVYGALACLAMPILLCIVALAHFERGGYE